MNAVKKTDPSWRQFYFTIAASIVSMAAVGIVSSYMFLRVSVAKSDTEIKNLKELITQQAELIKKLDETKVSQKEVSIYMAMMQKYVDAKTGNLEVSENEKIKINKAIDQFVENNSPVYRNPISKKYSVWRF